MDQNISPEVPKIPTPPVTQAAPKPGIKWNEVTWYSKLLSIIFLLGVVPVITFYIGMQYEDVKSITALTDIKNIAVKKDSSLSIYKNQEAGFSFQYPSSYDPIQATTTKEGALVLINSFGSSFFSYENKKAMSQYFSEYQNLLAQDQISDPNHQYSDPDVGLMTENDASSIQALDFFGIHKPLFNNADSYITIGDKIFKRDFVNVGNVGLGFYAYIATTTTESFLFSQAPKDISEYDHENAPLPVNKTSSDVVWMAMSLHVLSK